MSTKFYAVRKGVVPGIYTSWNDAKIHVLGFPGCEYKSFSTKQAAEQFMLNGYNTQPKAPSEPPKVVETPTFIPIDKSIVYVDGGQNSMTKDEAWGRVTDSFGNDILSNYLHLFPDLDIKNANLPVGLSSVIISKFNDVASQQNNGAELLAFLAALRISSVDPSISIICSDSKLLVSYWSVRLKDSTRNKMDPRKARCIDDVIQLRRLFETRGGKIVKVSGDNNPADLGFHK